MGTSATRTIATLLTVSGPVQNANLLTLNGAVQLNAGAAITGAPTYGVSSSLVYNAGLTAGGEWSVGTSGAGVPRAVTIQTGGGTVALPTGIHTSLGNLTITSGTLSLNASGTSDLNAALFPHGRLELGLVLGASLRVRAALAAGFATPRPVLLFAAERQEAWLNPLLNSSLGIEVALP